MHVDYKIYVKYVDPGGSKLDVSHRTCNWTGHTDQKKTNQNIYCVATRRPL